MDIEKLLGLLTIKKCAEREGVSVQTIYNWMRAGMPYEELGSTRLIKPDILKHASLVKAMKGTGVKLRKGYKKSNVRE